MGLETWIPEPPEPSGKDHGSSLGSREILKPRLVHVQALAGRELEVLEVKQRVSKYNGDPYIVARIRVDGEERILRTGARGVVDPCLRLATPFSGRVKARTSRLSGRTYHVLEPKPKP